MKDGFAIVPDVLSPAELEVIGGLVGAPSLARSRAGVRHLLDIPEISLLARDSRLLEMAAGALGGQAIPFGATLFDKSIDTNWLVAWHQDRALPVVERIEAPGWGPWSEKSGVLYAHAPAPALERVVALRIHLDDSTMDNGPLRVLPGTHTRGVLTDDEIHGFAERLAPVTCIVPRGGVVMLKPLIVHASSKVRGPMPRRVVHIEYADAPEFAPGVRLRLADALHAPLCTALMH
jgi:ectoine hydroxylase-related dioxygenase (phytanoyl-CoA dioxygenase family)